MAKKFKYIFTGGGSGGHVFPALALITELNEPVLFIGRRKGIEYNIITAQKLCTYRSISTGKLRRYVSFENLLDFFRVLKGVIESIILLSRFSHRKSIVMCTGGFVTVPVAIAAWIMRRKIILHEQTSRAGLANRINARLAERIFITFEESESFFPKERTQISGNLLRKDFMSKRPLAFKYFGIDFNSSKLPLLLITGGGNGSKPINELVQKNLEPLLESFIIIHQVGSSFQDEFSKFRIEGKYIPVGLLSTEMVDLLKIADVVLARSGAGTVTELMALNKKCVLIPLKAAQKNEQFHNAKAAEEQGIATLLDEDKLHEVDLVDTILTRSKTETSAPGGTIFGTKIVANYLR